VLARVFVAQPPGDLVRGGTGAQLLQDPLAQFGVSVDLAGLGSRPMLRGRPLGSRGSVTVLAAVPGDVPDTTLGLRSIRAAITCTSKPSTIPRDISSRSVSVSIRR
jgi:hypothetical protein